MATREEAKRHSLTTFQEKLSSLRHVDGLPDENASPIEIAEVIWPEYNKILMAWKVFVQDLLKEAVEMVFSKLAPVSYETANAQLKLHLQQVVRRALLHRSSLTGETTPLVQQETADMSQYISSNPGLWQSDVESSKRYLLEQCAQVEPVFEGENGIDQMFMKLLGLNVPLSSVLLQECSPFSVRLYYTSQTREHRSIEDFQLDKTENLKALLRFFYAIYQLMFYNNSEYFRKLGGPPFDDPTIVNFQTFFGSIPGDYFHYFYRCVANYEKDAYITTSEYGCVHMFFQNLAPMLCNTFSRVIYEHFGFSF